MDIDQQLQDIVNIMFTIALAIAVFKIVQIGIMFLLKPAGKANAKEAVFPWLVGALICASFITIGNWFIDLFSSSQGGGPFDIFICRFF